MNALSSAQAHSGSAFHPGGNASYSQYLDGQLKRAFDVGVAVAALVFFLPLFLLIAVAVRISSDGPILFRQLRGGKDRRKFKLLKFRSMYVQPCGAPVEQAGRGDQRVTPVGLILRKSSADELPQFWNVLRGEMSIVGPRPHAAEHDDYYAALIKRYPERARCKPGITGLAQVCGLRGATPTTDIMAERIDADLRYIETASFAGDVAIVLRTVWAILSCRDAAY